MSTKLEKALKTLGEKLRSDIKLPHSKAPKIKNEVLSVTGERFIFYLELLGGTPERGKITQEQDRDYEFYARLPGRQAKRPPKPSGVGQRLLRLRATPRRARRKTPQSAQEDARD